MKTLPNHLVAIAAIDDLGGLTAAAHKLQTLQAALSRVVSDIEVRLGAALFDKRSRPWRLTALGAALAQEGRFIQGAQARVSRAIEQFKTGDEGVVRRGGTPSFVDAIISGIVAGYHDTHRRIRVDQSYGYPEDLIAGMQRGDIDIAIYPIDILDESLELTFTPLRPARNIIACRNEHPLAGKTTDGPKVLLDYPWIAPPPGSPLNQGLRSSLASLGLQRFRIACSGGTLASVVNHLRASDLLAILPHSVVFAMRDSGGISALR